MTGIFAKRDLLITGFGPFPHVRINPTAKLAVAVAKRVGAKALVLETSYGKGLADLATTLAKKQPAAVLMLGLAAKARWVRVEVFARAGASPLSVDAKGRLPARQRVERPLPRRSTASTGRALASLRRHGVKARLSASAGRYLCNAGYALALAHARKTGIPVLFIHIPWLRPAAGTRRAGSIPLCTPHSRQLMAALSEIARGLVIMSQRTVP